MRTGVGQPAHKVNARSHGCCCAEHAACTNVAGTNGAAQRSRTAWTDSTTESAKPAARRCITFDTTGPANSAGTTDGTWAGPAEQQA